jgi:hypothetical protein
LFSYSRASDQRSFSETSSLAIQLQAPWKLVNDDGTGTGDPRDSQNLQQLAEYPEQQGK